MSKIFSVILCLVMIISLCASGYPQTNKKAIIIPPIVGDSDVDSKTRISRSRPIPVIVTDKDPIQKVKKLVFIKHRGGASSDVYHQLKIKMNRSQPIEAVVTDELNNPVPDVTVVFSIPGTLGRISQTKVATNSKGVASTLFESSTKGSGEVTANVEGTTISSKLRINVTGSGLSTAAKLGIIGAIVVGVGILTTSKVTVK